MNKMNLMTVLLACLALGACSNDDEQVPQQPEPQPLPEQTYPLTIEVTENPMIQDGEEGSGSRRTDIATGSTLTTFKMDYVYDTSETGSVTATKDGDGKWTSTGVWPFDARASDEEVDWYAYTDGTFQVNEGNPYISFRVDENVSSQKDLLVATAEDKKWSICGGNLSFTFDHACAALRFWVKKANNISGHTLSVTSIKLRNFINQGKYYYGTGTWTLTENSSYYTLFSGSAQTLDNTDYIAMDAGTPCYLFMIPQTLTAWNPTGALSNTYLELTCSITQGETPVYSGTAYIPFAATLVKGKKYDVKINIGKNSLYKYDSGTDTYIKIIP